MIAVRSIVLWNNRTWTVHEVTEDGNLVLHIFGLEDVTVAPGDVRLVAAARGK